MSKISSKSDERERPVEVNASELKLAKAGKFKEVHKHKLARRKPIQLSEKDMRSVKAGKSAEIMKRAAKKSKS